jgi:dTDP-4-dehydrorhamnose reductase
VIARARANGATLACAPEDVAPITTAEYPTAATRPLNSRLDATKLRSTFGLTLPAWTDDVDAVVDHLCTSPVA